MSIVKRAVNKVMAWFAIGIRVAFGGALAGVVSSTISPFAHADEGGMGGSDPGSGGWSDPGSGGGSSDPGGGSSGSGSSDPGSSDPGSSSSSSDGSSDSSSCDSSSADSGSCSAGTCDIAGDNPFHVRNGNAVRVIKDLKVRGTTVKKAGLSWQRYQFTAIQRDTEGYFGAAGTWRHSWQYNLYEKPVTGSTQPALVMVMPNGKHRTLLPTTSGRWVMPGSPEGASEKSGGIEYTDRGGRSYYFARKGGAALGDTGNRYQMTRLTNAHGVVTNLQYDGKGYLSKVTEAGGRSLNLSYRDIAGAGATRFVIAGVKDAPHSGQWLEYIVPANLNHQLLRYLRFRAADATAVSVAEIQVFSAGSSEPLHGTVIGSNASASAAFDGGAATSFTSTTDTVGYCGLDFGTAGAQISKIRILAASGQESSITNGVIEGFSSQPTNTHVLSQVQVSNGRTVNYDYTTVSDQLPGLSYVGLSAAHYGDSTTASYQYGFASDGGTPLLTEANDPRYARKLAHVKYTYNTNQFDSRGGAIHQEISGDTGVVLSTLDIDPTNPNRRIVKYGDLRTVSYGVAVTGTGKLAMTDLTDSLGRTTRLQYANPDGSGPVMGKIDSLGRKTVIKRDGQGRLLEITRDNKTLKRLVRDTAGRVVSNTGADGFTKTLTRDANGRIARVTDALGAQRQRTYDSLGKRATKVLPTGGVVNYSHDATGRLMSKVTADGHKIAYNYDANDRVASRTDALNRTKRFEYNERGLRTKITYPDKTSKVVAYDDYGRVAQRTDRRGQMTQFSYDEHGRVVRKVDRLGRTTNYEYASLPEGCGCSTFAQHPTRIVDRRGSVILRLYDTEGRLLSHTSAAGTTEAATTTFTHDDDDNLVLISDPLGQASRFTYDNEHHRLSMTDPAGRTTLWAYNSGGDVVSITAPGGGVTQKAYDAKHHLTQLTDPAGQVTSYKYDASGRVAQSIDPAGQKFKYVYDAGGHRTAIIYPDGKQQTMDYDAANRLIKKVSYDGLATTYSYDAGDHILKQSSTAPGDPTPQVQTYTYDTLGRRISSTDALGRTTQWTYDARGNVLTTVQPGGGVQATNTYDTQNHLTSTQDAAGQITRYVYSAADELITLTDAKGNSYGFTYDGQHRKTSMIYPDGSKETWKYNLTGFLVGYTTRAGQTKSIVYNAAGQPISETWTPDGAGTNLSYTYDQSGRLASLDNGLVKLTYTYDALNRLASETTDVSALISGVLPQTVMYNYDGLGRKANLVYPNGAKLTYSYDALNRLVSLNDGSAQSLATYTYDTQGRVSKLTRDNNVITNYAYDLAGQLTDIAAAKGGSPLISSHYDFDPVGRRVAQTREDNLPERYTYDATSQLTSADYGMGRSETFAYDVAGNRTQAAQVGASGKIALDTYSVNNLNQYLSINRTVSSYDINGNLVNDGTQAYTYDAQNRLTSVESTSVRAEFSYDAKNRCVLRRFYTRGSQNQWVINASASRLLTYDTNWNLLIERQLDGTQVGSYILGARIDEVFKASIGSQSVYPLVDGLGSTVALTNANGAIVERFRYDAYGQVHFLDAAYQTRTSSAAGYRLLFSGREWLAQVSLNDHRNRYFSPAQGRWINTDPIRFGSDTNLYAYVSNSPLTSTDSSGLMRDCDAEHITCFQNCWNRCPPWPIKRGSSGHYAYCQTSCLASYMECEAANAAEKLRQITQQAADWIAAHQTAIVGTIVVIGAVVFIVATDGAGALILVPAGG